MGTVSSVLKACPFFVEKKDKKNNPGASVMLTPGLSVFGRGHD